MTEEQEDELVRRIDEAIARIDARYRRAILFYRVILIGACCAIGFAAWGILKGFL